MTKLHLPIQFTGFWLHAHGEGGGADFDRVMERDGDGLPELRGRHVAGLLRVALERAALWGWFGEEFGDEIADLLMGFRAEAPLARGGSEGAPGLLSFTHARVSPALAWALRDQPDLRSQLFKRIPSTAIDRSTGAAKRHHLRTLEAGQPIMLYSEVGFDPSARVLWAGPDQHRRAAIRRAEDKWRDWITTAWPAFDEAGAKRTRGFGRLAYVELGQPA